jgi:hypothetical protein
VPHHLLSPPILGLAALLATAPSALAQPDRSEPEARPPAAADKDRAGAPTSSAAGKKVKTEEEKVEEEKGPKTEKAKPGADAPKPLPAGDNRGAAAGTRDDR